MFSFRPDGNFSRPLSWYTYCTDPCGGTRYPHVCTCMSIATILALCAMNVNHQALAPNVNEKEQQLQQTKLDEESHATSASDGLHQRQWRLLEKHSINKYAQARQRVKLYLIAKFITNHELIISLRLHPSSMACVAVRREWNVYSSVHVCRYACRAKHVYLWFVIVFPVTTGSEAWKWDM